MYYLNKLDSTDKVDDSEYENLRCVKSILVNEFEEYNKLKLIVVVSIVDNLFITLTVAKLQDILIETDTLRENILYLISFKHFVDIIVKLIYNSTHTCINIFSVTVSINIFEKITLKVYIYLPF